MTAGPLPGDLPAPKRPPLRLKVVTDAEQRIGVIQAEDHRGVTAYFIVDDDGDHFLVPTGRMGYSSTDLRRIADVTDAIQRGIYPTQS